MTGSKSTDRATQMQEAANAAAQERQKLRIAAQSARKKALAQARAGKGGASTAKGRSKHVKRGALANGGGGTITYAMAKGAYRALRHAPGVVGLLWLVAEDVEKYANAALYDDIAAAGRPAEDHTERHFRADGAPGGAGNSRGTYRASVRTYTKRAVHHQHDDHLLEAALIKAKGAIT